VNVIKEIIPTTILRGKPLFHKRLTADSQTKTDKSQCRTALPIKMLNVHHAEKKIIFVCYFYSFN